MAGFRLPNQVNETIIDLADYGGEGKLGVRNMQVGDSLKVSQIITDKATADGYTIRTDKDLQDLISTRYKFDMLEYYLKSCVTAYDDDGKRSLADDEIWSLPPDLIVKIMDILEEGAKFPLEQKDGQGPKQERCKPTGEEY